jgi:cytochrome c553
MHLRAILILIAGLLPLQLYAQGDAEAGRTKAHTCTGCHGIEGYHNVYPTYKVPRIGGQSAPYLEAALRAYRDGERSHPTMRAHAQSLSEQDIADITSWLSSIKRHRSGSGGAQEPPESSQLCQACHGPDGESTDPAYPVLAGQHQSYLSRALLDYRSGARRNAVMGGFAGNLTDRDIEVLSRWYASRDGLRNLAGQ